LEIAEAFLDLAEALAEESFPARMAAWLRLHPSPPGTQEVRLQRLHDVVSRYLAARLLPSEVALQPTRQQFDTETANVTADDRAITFFCAEAVARHCQRLTARGVRSFALSNLEEAELHLATATAYDANNALALWNQARLSLARGQRLEALERYAALLELLPDAVSALRPELEAATGRQLDRLQEFACPVGTRPHRVGGPTETA
jgi:tetratricopeptide (TPR) repeat protein